MTLVDGLKVDADGFFDHLADEAHQAITEIETAGCWTRSSMTQWFGAVDQTIDDSVALLKAVTDTLLELMKLALQWMLDTLSYQIQILPNDFQYTLIGQIFKAAKIDPTISVGHLVALVCAYPATLINGLHNGGSLFPTTASQAAAVRHVRALERRGLLGLSGSGSKHRRGPGHQGWGPGRRQRRLGDRLGHHSRGGAGDLGSERHRRRPADGHRGRRHRARGFVLLRLDRHLLPGGADDPAVAQCAVTGRHHGVPVLRRHDTSSEYWPMLPWVIASGIFPALSQLVSMRKPSGAGTNQPAPQGVADPLADYYDPIIQMVSGSVNTVLGTSYNVKTSAGGPAIAAGVLGNVSYMLAVLAQKYVNEAAEDVPVLIKTVVDAAGNVGAAICIAEATGLPPK